VYPLISVVIIGYKRIDELKKTHSTFLQNINYPRDRIELILCDDGSPYEMQQEMKKLDFDKFLLSSKNEGMGKNTNKGLIAATGDYIVQLHDDGSSH